MIIIFYLCLYDYLIEDTPEVQVLESSPYVFSSPFVDSILVSRYLIYFEFTFVTGLRWGTNFILEAIQLSQHHLLKKTLFIPLHIISSFFMN